MVHVKNIVKPDFIDDYKIIDNLSRVAKLNKVRKKRRDFLVIIETNTKQEHINNIVFELEQQIVRRKIL
jgi:polyribonucleotide nucleotidyltransferase